MPVAILARNQPLASSEKALWDAWEEFSAALRQARGRAAQEQGGLTIPQYRLLAAVSAMPTARTGELATQLMVSAPTVARMLSGLESDGAIKRRPLTADRRGASVELTRKGRELLERKEAVVSEKRRALWSSLTADERRQAELLFRRLAEVIEAL